MTIYRALGAPVSNPTPPSLRIRWINPIGVDAYDQPIVDQIEQMKAPGTCGDLISLKMSTPSPMDLEYRTFEALIASDLIRVARDTAQNNFDALVIGCFYDPYIDDVRNISGSTVVVAPCMASMTIVTALADRFSVIIGQQFWADQMTETIRAYGFGSKLASMRAVGLSVEEFQVDPARTKRLMIEAGRKAVEKDRAEALVLGCTIEYGFYEELSRTLGVPVIDSGIAAFKTAEYLAGVRRQFGWVPSRVGGCTPPPEDYIAKYKLFEGPPPIGNRIEF